MLDDARQRCLMSTRLAGMAGDRRERWRQHVRDALRERYPEMLEPEIHAFARNISSKADLAMFIGASDTVRGIERPQSPELAGLPYTATIGALAVAAAELEQAKERVDTLAQQAKEQGAPWSAIGEAVGISPQAAHQRWSPGGRERHAESQRRRFRS